MNLPPLPQKVQIDKHIPSGYVILGYTADQMRKYAEAAVVAERERIALAWDACLHEGTPCDMDIGASIRAGELVPWVGGA
jgi:hypothetical protein